MAAAGRTTHVNSPPGRRAYIDWARGAAVLVMIEAHAADAWTRAADKNSAVYRDATILGGFAAPMFLWLAGLAVVLAATRSAERSGSRGRAVEAIVRRGLVIFLLAFLFRVQAFIVSPGNHLVTLFRVDILNIMGPAIVAAGMVWALARTAPMRAALFAAMALAFSMLTPIVRASPLVERLPVWLQWHLRPAGDMTVFTMLPWAGFVFAGAAVGALLAAVRDERQERRLNAAVGACGAALVAIGFYTASRPSIYASSSFWTSSPTWFAIRVGILMLALSWLYGIEQTVGRREEARTHLINGGVAPRAARRPSGKARRRRIPGVFDGGATQPDGMHRRPNAGPIYEMGSRAGARHGTLKTVLLAWQAPLERLGQHSLFIYWIHVELVYGYFSWLWWHRLPLWGTAIAYALFCVLMYRAIEWRDRFVDFWRTRPRGALISAASG